MTTLLCQALGWRADDRWIVHDIATAIAPACLTCVIGVNGSGKTTLLRLLSGLLRPDQGRVLLDGRDLRRVPRRVVARAVAFMEQLPTARVDLSVRDVVALGRIPHEGRWRLASNQSAIAGAMGLAGVDELAGRSWNTLSGGERQRVQLARALAQEPSVLMLDEPTNHLDLNHQISLLRLVKSLGLTTVVVLHDLDLAAAFADRLIVLDAGRLVAEGPTQQVLTEHMVATRFKVRGRVSHGRRMGFWWDGLVDDQ